MSKQYCEHIYKDTGKDICPKCGGYTHETIWSYQHYLHKDWIESGKAELQGWTSI